MHNWPQSGILNDGSRLHLNHGPIDLIIEAFGDNEVVHSAYEKAQIKFNHILTELVAELSLLRAPVSQNKKLLKSAIGLRMQDAVYPFYPTFVTPMAAVAGAVADYMLSILCENNKLRKAYVNNGGDIAVYLEDDEVFNIGIVTDLKTRAIWGTTTLTHIDNINGIATSGRHGRSHSLGIADAVTVLAKNSAQADAAATLIANEVDVQDTTLVKKIPANELYPDSDLTDQLVTVDVAKLPKKLAERAVAQGCDRAVDYIDRGLIKAATISLQGIVEVVGSRHLLTQNCNAKT